MISYGGKIVADVTLLYAFLMTSLPSLYGEGVVPVPDRPYFFLPTLLFFQSDSDRATLFSPGGCGLLPKWRLLSH
jgi:hypothetical protein